MNPGDRFKLFHMSKLGFLGIFLLNATIHKEKRRISVRTDSISAHWTNYSSGEVKNQEMLKLLLKLFSRQTPHKQTTINSPFKGLWTRINLL